MSLKCKCHVQWLCFGKELFTCLHKGISVHIYEELFSETWYPNLALVMAGTIFRGFLKQISVVRSILHWATVRACRHQCCGLATSTAPQCKPAIKSSHLVIRLAPGWTDNRPYQQTKKFLSYEVKTVTWKTKSATGCWPEVYAGDAWT